MVRKIVVEQTGGPEVLQLVQAADPAPGPGELLVRVAAAGVNYLDIYQRQGLFMQGGLPFTPGLEGTGTVVALGSGIASFRPGDRVSWISQLGSYADHLLLPAARAIPLPETITTADAPTKGLLFQAVTAQYLSTEFRSIRPGTTALVHAAAGGVGQLLTQWLTHLGARVIATASSEQKLERARDAGAAVLINYRESSFLEATRDATGGRGVDIAFDSVGKTTFADTVQALAPRGTAVLFGTASGNPPLLDPVQLVQGSRRIAAGELFEHINDPNELQMRARAVLDAVAAGWLTLHPGRSYALADAAKAQADLESRETEGKLLLLP